MKREVFALAFLVCAFITIRLFGVELPLHQDEYKWPPIVNPAIVSETEIPHPPLSQFIYQTGGAIVGYDVHLRFVPLFFGTLNLILLYLVLRGRFGVRTAFIGAGLFTVSFYSILASLMVDTDGQIMPFFFLVSLLAYDRLKTVTQTLQSWFWGVVLAGACLAGFFVKVSFILAIAALCVDFLWSRRHFLSRSDVMWYVTWLVVGVSTLASLLLVTQYLFSFFNLSFAFEYWKHFWTEERNWFQTAIQVAKSVLYLSPLLVIPALMSVRFFTADEWKKTTVMWLYLLFGMVFYTIVFDFSIGALDRYLQFTVVPLCIIAAVVLTRLSRDSYSIPGLLCGVLFAVVLFYIQLAPHAVPALHPKAEWIGRILSLNWFFLYPFSGGSGPLGFYVSFLFMGISWVVAGMLALGVLARPKIAGVALSFLLPLGLMYNGVFVEEYLFGKVNGFTSGLVERAAAFIATNPDIKKVVVYNDNGGNEIQATGKYEKRLYTSPQFDVRDKVKTMNAFSGHYLVVDVPPIDPKSVYAQYFATCVPAYKDTDQAMSAIVYDCRKAPDIQL